MKVTIGVGDPQGRQFEVVEVVVDTGSTYTAVPREMLQRLGVPVERALPSETAEGRILPGRRRQDRHQAERAAIFHSGHIRRGRRAQPAGGGQPGGGCPGGGPFGRTADTGKPAADLTKETQGRSQETRSGDRRPSQSDRTLGTKTAQEPFSQLPGVRQAGSNLLMETEMSQNTAASYTRVSPDSQHSIMAQLEWISRVADEQGLSMAREYEDEGDAGATDDRPGFQRMIADALSDERPFDTIIVYDFARFSRSASDLIRYRDQLEETGVRLLCATEHAAS